MSTVYFKDVSFPSVTQYKLQTKLRFPFKGAKFLY